MARHYKAQYYRPARAPRRTKRRQSRAVKQRNKNSKAIAKLVKQVYIPRQFVLQKTGTISSGIAIYPIIKPDDYTPAFQNYNSVAGSGVGSIYHMSGVKTKWFIQPEDVDLETANVMIQVFIVGMRPLQARKFRESGNTLVADFHYTSVALDTVAGALDGFGLVMLNREIFDVKYNSGIRRIANATLTGTDVTTIQDTATHGGSYIRHKRTIQGENPSQLFSSMSNTDIRDSTQLYMITFSNASSTSPLFYTNNHVIYGSTTRGV